jgi:hypothetical protein
LPFDILFGSEVKKISPKEVEERLRKGDIQILDVRSEEEYKQGHIPNSINIPLSELENRLNELDRSKEIITVCASGVRSDKAARRLMEMRFDIVKNMSGGMMAWEGKVVK